MYNFLLKFNKLALSNFSNNISSPTTASNALNPPTTAISYILSSPTNATISKNIKLFFLLIILTFFSCLGNNGEVVLSYLLNNKLTILLKGTYASDNPYSFTEINSNSISKDSDDSILNTFRDQTSSGCDPYNEYACIPSYDKIPIYIDIGGIRLTSKPDDINTLSGGTDVEKFWNIASNERQIFCSNTYINNPKLDTCLYNDGLNAYNDFMNGKGAIYPSKEIPDTWYLQAGIFIRRIVTGWGYNNKTLVTTTTFDNNLITGINIINLVGLDPPSGVGNNSWFPLLYKTDPNQFLYKAPEYSRAVLEIRINIKENLMAHSFTFTDSNNVVNNNVVVAFTDWNSNHVDNGTNTSSAMGGNVLTRARIFYPHLVSRLNLNNTSSNANSCDKKCYYAIYLNNDTDSSKSGKNLPIHATPARSGANSINHIMPGSYTLQCRRAINNPSYPEAIISTKEITIPDTPADLPIMDYACP